VSKFFECATTAFEHDRIDIDQSGTACATQPIEGRNRFSEIAPGTIFLQVRQPPRVIDPPAPTPPPIDMS